MSKNKYAIFAQFKPGTEIDLTDVQERAQAWKTFRDYYAPEPCEVRAYGMVGDDNPKSPNFGKRDIAKVDTGDFKPDFEQLQTWMRGTSNGKAERGFKRSTVFGNMGAGKKTNIHEFLHNGMGEGFGTGCGHSGTFKSVMGDNTSVMGSVPDKRIPTGMISPHICHMGWNDPKHTITVTETTQVLIGAVENECLHDNEMNHCIIKVEGFNDFYLSTRCDYPYDRGDSRAEKLYVHELIMDSNEQAKNTRTTRHKPDLMPGDVAELPNGSKLFYVGMSDGIARVNVFIKGKETEILARNVFLPSYGAPPTTGSYYAPVSSGHGWDVHVNDKGEMVGFWFTGRDTGEPRWMYFEGTAGTELDLFEIVGATVQDPTTGKPEKVGSCRFTGDRFAFRINGIRGGIKVVPLLPTPSLSGIYFWKPRNNEGIAVHLFTDAEGVEKCSVNFYTFRRNAIGVRHTDTWYSCEGILEGKVYELKIYETEGKFQSYGAKTKQVGSGTLSVRGNVVDFGFAIGKRDEQYTMSKLFGAKK